MMPWAKFDDHFDDDADLSQLSCEAVTCHVCGVTWSARHLSDGYIDKHALRHLKGATTRALSQLCSVGWWEPLPEGAYQIRSYLAYNPSRAQIKAERESSNDRVHKHRNAKRNALQNPNPRAGPRPDPGPDCSTNNGSAHTQGATSSPSGSGAPPAPEDSERVEAALKKWLVHLGQQTELPSPSEIDAYREALTESKNPAAMVNLAIQKRWKVLREPFDTAGVLRNGAAPSSPHPVQGVDFRELGSMEGDTFVSKRVDMKTNKPFDELAWYRSRKLDPPAALVRRAGGGEA